MIDETEMEHLHEANSASIRQRPNLPYSVVIFDDLPEREKFVGQLIYGIAVPHSPKTIARRNLQHVVAIVGLPNSVSSNHALEVILRLRGQGQIVIAYADGVNAWDIATKCRPIVAGARTLLDSSKIAFKKELIKAVDDAILVALETERDLPRLRAAMVQHGIIGESVAITDAFLAAIRYSGISDLPVLITGESGTGKELLAKAIAVMDPQHNHGPFVAVNCAAVPSTMAESEVFGHRRGAFTGADHDRKGWIRSADRGVLFMDEIGELEYGLQSKFLRVLQDACVRGVGEDKDVQVKTRFLAATNRNLGQMVRNGEFRNDLLNRLHVLTVQMPSLAQRREDIRLLVEHFVEKHRSIPLHAIVGISEDYVTALENVQMPGNVRELENIVRQSLVHPHNPGMLSLHDLPMEVLARVEDRNANAVPENEGGPTSQIESLAKCLVNIHGWNLQSTLRECERIMCLEALKLAHGNQSEAARRLGITSRCIYNKLHRFGK